MLFADTNCREPYKLKPGVTVTVSAKKTRKNTQKKHEKTHKTQLFVPTTTSGRQHCQMQTRMYTRRSVSGHGDRRRSRDVASDRQSVSHARGRQANDSVRCARHVGWLSVADDDGATECTRSFINN